MGLWMEWQINCVGFKIRSMGLNAPSSFGGAGVGCVDWVYGCYVGCGLGWLFGYIRGWGIGVVEDG